MGNIFLAHLVSNMLSVLKGGHSTDYTMYPEELTALVRLERRTKRPDG